MTRRNRNLLTLAVVAMAAFAFTAAPASAELVGYWDFNEGSGTDVADFSTKGNDGTVVGTAQWVDGHTEDGAGGDWAIDFADQVNANQGNTQVVVPDSDSLDLTGMFTIAFWFNESGSTTDNAATFLSKGAAYALKSDTEGTGFRGYPDAAAEPRWAAPYTVNTWHHLARTYDGTDIKWYLDGVFHRTDPYAAPIAPVLEANADPLLFGRGPGIPTQEYWPGDLDDLVIFDTVEDIGDIMDGTHSEMTGGDPPVPTVKEREWFVDGMGDWKLNGSWTPANAPDGGDYEVLFGDVIETGDATVVSDLPVTVKGVIFNNDANSNSYAIGGKGVLTLQDTFEETETSPVDLASIEVVTGTHEFQLSVTLGSPTKVDVAVDSELIFTNALNLGTFQLEKDGEGLMSVNNDITAEEGGGILLSEGTLGGRGVVGGDLVVIAGGIVAPGNSIGTLGVTGDATINAGATLVCEVGGNTADKPADKLAVGGVLKLDGEIQLDWLPTDKDSPFGGVYTLATYDSVEGTAVLGTNGNIGSHYVKTDSLDAGATALTVELHPLVEGDTDTNCTVGADDLALMAVNWTGGDTTQGKTWADGDFNFDGSVDSIDLAFFAVNWTGGAFIYETAGSDGIVPVPEPGSIIMLLIGAAGLLLYRKRR